ncbi:unnamed protein product [Spirodela intermedia]|uniref:Uncharacterized protein n=1 Tax=Spirodela intermedia TaxID=51605 RepID=A0A7I8KMS7_SPIIN|nr:unnamed protein product [Spirodela intermedia]
MGTAISRAASGIGTILGNTFLAPIKTILSASCEGVCSGTWDVICFIEHLCISDMLKLLMVLLIAYLTLFFIYLLFKVGIVQCIGKNLCKMSWAACETYWSALGGITCFLWHKLKDTKRVYHRRRRRRRRLHDVEDGYSSGEDGDMWDSRIMSERESTREKKRAQVRRRRRKSLQPKSQRWKMRRYARKSRRHSLASRKQLRQRSRKLFRRGRIR